MIWVLTRVLSRMGCKRELTRATLPLFLSPPWTAGPNASAQPGSKLAQPVSPAEESTSAARSLPAWLASHSCLVLHELHFFAETSNALPMMAVLVSLW